MARGDDRSRSAMLKALIDQHMIYGDENTAVNAMPGGEGADDNVRGVEQRDMIRKMPPRVGSDGRNQINNMQRHDDLKRDAAPGSDMDVEADEQLEDEAPVAPSKPYRPIPNKGPIIPQGPEEDADYGNEMSSNQEMVTMPKSLAYSAMDKLMQSASRNAISKSAPEQQMAMNDGGDLGMQAKMRRMPLASDTTTNEDDWQNNVNYQGSAAGARAAGVIGKKANSNKR